MILLRSRMRQGALTAMAVAIAALSAGGEADARQYISLLPNYSNLIKNEPLDYWSYTQDSDQHNISELWTLPNASMITKADFSNCTFRYSHSDKVISYTPSFTLGAEDEAGYMELTLALDENGQSPWNISRVEIYAVNAFNPDYNYKPSFTINGIRATLPPDNTRDYCGVDFPDDAAPVTTLRFETPVNSRVSFWDMKIYLKGQPQLPEDYIYRDRRTFGEDETLSFPVVKIGTLNPAADGRLQCSLTDENGEILAMTTDVTDDRFLFNADEIEEGRYRVCYHIQDISEESGIERCHPDPEDGLPLAIEPTFKGMMINGVEAGDFAYIPDEVEGTDLSWENAHISGLREGVEVYWMTSKSSTAAEAKGRAAEAGADEPIPSDFNKYDDNTGLTLTGADRLHIILAKNGVRTAERILPYSLPIGSVGVALTGAEVAGAEWFTIDGRRVDPSGVAEGTVMIRIVAGERPLKVVK